MPDPAHDLIHAARAEEREAERWLKISAVCRRLCVDKRTVYAWIEDGTIPDEGAMRLPGSGHWRVRVTAVEGLEQKNSRRLA